YRPSRGRKYLGHAIRDARELLRWRGARIDRWKRLQGRYCAVRGTNLAKNRVTRSSVPRRPEFPCKPRLDLAGVFQLRTETRRSPPRRPDGGEDRARWNSRPGPQRRLAPSQ